MRTMTVALLACSLSLVALPSSAQTITSYNLLVYDQGGTTPILTNSVTAWTCNLPAAPPNAPTVNPNTLEWEDVANAGMFCHADQTQFLLSIPFGQSGSRLLEGVLIAIGPGGTSDPSNRAPFERLAAAPIAPTAFRMIRSS